MHVTLLQPRYPHGRLQTYMSGSLMNLGSRLLSKGVDVSFADLNHTSLDQASTRETIRNSDVLGFTALGAPYIPVIADSVERLRADGGQQKVLVGGEGVVRLQPTDFEQWFAGLGVHQVRSDVELEQALGLELGSLPSMFATSMSPMLRKMTDVEKRRYLTSEFALFLGYGCKFKCRYCQAAKAQREQYRTFESLEDELEYICGYLASINHRKLQVYLSNLDIFQTADQLEEALSRAHSIATSHGISFSARGLATSRCTFQACSADPNLPRRLNEYGLDMVSFGADGADEETWQRENKQHNAVLELEESLRYMKRGGITPELLMVIGFPEDSWKSMWTSIKFSLRHALRGVIIRPYMAKLKTPGGLWTDGDSEVEAYRADRNLLKKMDYAMCGSSETHPRWSQRLMVNAVYLGLIGLLTPFGLCGTRPLFPVPRKGFVRRLLATAINRIMPFDR